MHQKQWSWCLPEWPKFTFDEAVIQTLNEEFQRGVGASIATLKYLDSPEKEELIVEVLSLEGTSSSLVEGEILQRESVQSSIRRHFNLTGSDDYKTPLKERGMADLMVSVFKEYGAPLCHNILRNWHNLIFTLKPTGLAVGDYRSHDEPMQIVSSRYGDTKVFYEAPPSILVYEEMTKFIEWFNASSSLSPLVRASIAHLYFEMIHPFEDGNGRIGRALVEKALAQSVKHPTLISISSIIEKKRKDYYAQLATCNESLNAQAWIEYFSKVIVDAQKSAMKILDFLIFKSKLMRRLEGQINRRQEKVLIRMFKEGVDGFKGGLSADNYISITKCSRATATRDLNDLIQKEALLKTGERRYTRYWLDW